MIHPTRKSRQRIESRSVRTHATGIVSELEPFYSIHSFARLGISQAFLASYDSENLFN